MLAKAHLNFSSYKMKSMCSNCCNVLICTLKEHQQFSNKCLEHTLFYAVRKIYKTSVLEIPLLNTKSSC